MKQLLLLGVMFSLFFFSCKTAADSDSQQDISPEKETPKPQQTQETYVEIINSSLYPIDLYSSSTRDAYSLIGANIAPDNNYKIPITDAKKEMVYYVVFHIHIAELDVPYWDDDSGGVIAIREGKISRDKVINPSINIGSGSWIILENRSPSGLRLVKDGSDEWKPENRPESSLINTEEFGVYKLYPSDFDNLKIKKAFGSAEIPFPFTEIESGKIYKLAVDDDLKCSLESTYSFNCRIEYETAYGEQADVDMIIGETLTEKQLPIILTDENYVFDGWYNGDQLITEGYIIQSDITLTAKWKLIQYKIEYETKCDKKIEAKIITKGESVPLPELTGEDRKDYIFDGWYIGETKVVADEYTVTNDVTLKAGWIKYLDDFEPVSYHTITESLIFDFSDLQNFDNLEKKYSGYLGGVLTVHPMVNEDKIEQIIFKGVKTAVFKDLCLKFSDAWTSKPNIIFDNFSFSSSKPYPLVKASVGLSIEYKGYNELTSSATKDIPLIKSSGDIEFRGLEESSKICLKTNTVTTSKKGSIGIEADKPNTVTINGGNLEIKGSDGWNNSTKGRDGGDGSTGIKASTVVIKNGAVVNIVAGNGVNGNNGTDYKGIKREKQENDGKTGHSGYSGGDGGNAGNGGTAIDGNLTVIAGALTLKGGKGGTGGNGGTGGDGGDGGYGPDMATAPGNGGDGGKGGKAGKGGDGGDAINGTLQIDNKDLSDVSLIAGTCGKNGTPGEGGKGGDVGSRSFWGWTNITAKRYPGAPGERGDPADDPPPCDGVQHR